ncbi:MAG: cache domain-containing protein [Methyloceanibacter sp.]|uniref:cache domain-containing protein n=1 Tax=Methyloceanibacter sp. TaxID=1965321 RepID=UPI003D9B697F
MRESSTSNALLNPGCSPIGRATAGRGLNASDEIVTAHPYGNKGKQLRDILGKKGYPLGEEMMQKATEGTIREVTYWWPRPGTDTPLEKISYYTKVGDQICGVGYYKG